MSKRDRQEKESEVYGRGKLQMPETVRREVARYSVPISQQLFSSKVFSPNRQACNI